MEVLELVDRGEALDVEAVGRDHIGLATEEVLGFKTSDITTIKGKKDKIKGRKDEKENLTVVKTSAPRAAPTSIQ